VTRPPWPEKTGAATRRIAERRLRRGFRSRFLVEAAFILLVTGLVWRDGPSVAELATSVAAACLLVALAEWSLRGREPPPLGLEAAAESQPEPEHEPEPEPEPEPPQVVQPAPRAWNLWDLERKARETAEPDTARGEERSFLLMYLREFAATDGALPVEFDPLVRESFADLVETARP
jgi:hypothetical protein